MHNTETEMEMLIQKCQPSVVTSNITVYRNVKHDYTKPANNILNAFGRVQQHYTDGTYSMCAFTLFCCQRTETHLCYWYSVKYVYPHLCTAG